MRVFWVILILAVLGAGAWLALPERATLVESARSSVALESHQKEQIAKRELDLAANDAGQEDAGQSREEAERLQRRNDELQQQLAALKAEAAKLAESTTPPTPAPPAPPPLASGAVTGDAADKMGAVGGAVPPSKIPALSPAEAASGAETSPVAEASGAPKQMIAGFEVVPATVTEADDGSPVYDGKYPIKGEGTAESPYVITWDLLVSAEETFDPQKKRRTLPERVAMLDGKVVKIGGNIAFPLMVQQPRELLVMLNQWDGCCIGVPPTPYDAVEVQLSKAITGEGRFATMGSVTGRLSVKPYIVGDWLVGLYLMEQAEMSPNEFGGEAGN